MAKYQVHRNNDLRNCGATTVVVGQNFVFVNGKLWAVRDDPNTHGDGQLINAHTGIFINGIPVIVNTPDPARPDDAPHENPATAQGSPNVLAYK